MANENIVGVVNTTQTRAEQSASIKEAIKLKAGVVAIGNGGSSVGVYLRNAGYPVSFANTSFKDLDTAIVPDDQDAYLIEDMNAQSRGAGRDRSIAKEIYKSWNQTGGIFKSERFDSLMRENDIIFVIASTAGGTGSGLAPTLSYQISKKYPDKVVIPVAILPRDTESIKSQYNTIDYFNELDSINKAGDVSLSYMVYDLNNLSHMSADESYKQIATDIVAAINVICGSMSEITKHGMIDERDMLTIISAPGLMTIVSDPKIDLNKVGSNGIQHMMLDKLNGSSVCQIQRDKICRYYGVFLKIQEESEDDVVKNDYTTMTNVTGKPLDIFVNYATTEGSFSSYGMIISGQSLPFDRINRCADMVKEYQENQRAKEYDLSTDMQSLRGLTKNSQHNKLMGCASKARTDAIVEGDTLPDFLQ